MSAKMGRVHTEGKIIEFVNPGAPKIDSGVLPRRAGMICLVRDGGAELDAPWV
jgi:hypothetical protein